jgi:hypothetical protein
MLVISFDAFAGEKVMDNVLYRVSLRPSSSSSSF